MTLTTEELKAMLDAEYERGKSEDKQVEVIKYAYVPPPVYPVVPPTWPHPIITCGLGSAT